MIGNIFVLLLLNVPRGSQVELDYISCGIDPNSGAKNESTAIESFPWLGILYYTMTADGDGYNRATTMVIMIHRQYVIGCAEDISTIPLAKLRTSSRVLLSDSWASDRGKLPGYEVHDYLVHPEFKTKTLNTMAIVRLAHAIKDDRVWPVCPPTATHLPHTPLFNIIINDAKDMTKTFRKMTIVNKQDCNNFYKRAKLSYHLMRPTLSLCAVASSERPACIWESGSALASRDPWGRWRLVGFGVRGPGCGAPSRYLSIIGYTRWFESVFVNDDYLTVLRQGPSDLIIRKGPAGYRYRESNRYGLCDETDTKWDKLYNERSTFTCDQLQPVSGSYKFVMTRHVNFTCIRISTLSATNAMKPYIWVHNICAQGKNCHDYLNSTGTLIINFVFTFSMTLTVDYLGTPFNSTTLPDAKEIKRLVIEEWINEA